MKNLLSVNKQWNRLMEIIGTPIMVFILLSWCSYTIGINVYSMCICFTLAVLFGSPNFYLAICESILGIPFLMMFREWFLIPINLQFWKPHLHGGANKPHVRVLQPFSLLCGWLK